MQRNPFRNREIKKLNLFYLSSIAWGVVAQSPEPGAHVLNARAFRIELEFRNVGFCGEGKTGVPGEKPLGAEKRTNNKLNPHMTSSPGIEPGSHWWKASALTTPPSLLPQMFSQRYWALPLKKLLGETVVYHWALYFIVPAPYLMSTHRTLVAVRKIIYIALFRWGSSLKVTNVKNSNLL